MPRIQHSPSTFMFPSAEQKKRQATAPARALKDRSVKVEPKTRSSDFSQTWPRKRSSRVIQEQVKRDNSSMKGQW